MNSSVHRIGVDEIFIDTLPDSKARMSFEGWSDGGGRYHDVEIRPETNVYTANFWRKFWVDIQSNGSGTVYPKPGWYDSTSTVDISAKADCNFTFGEWTGDGPGAYVGLDSSASVVLTAPLEQTASFEFSPIPDDNFHLTQYPNVNGQVEWFDYDGDGDFDLWYQNPTVYNKPLYIYENQGGTIISPPTIITGVSGAAEWFDYDGDGDYDLWYQNPTVYNKPLYIYENQGGTIISPPTIITGVSGAAEWFDYDGDGDFDLWWHNATQHPYNLYIYINDYGNLNPALTFSNINGSASWFDYDGDGDYDLWWHNASQYPYYLNINKNESDCKSHWLTLRLQENEGLSKSFLTTSVSVTAGGRTLVRQDTGEPVFFGLGSASRFDGAEIRWSSGKVQMVPGGPVDTTLVIVEDIAPAGVDIILNGDTTNLGIDTVIVFLEGPFELSRSVPVGLPGTESACAFAWLHDGDTLFDGNEITGAHTSKLSIAAAKPWHTGEYTLVSSNSAGTAISDPVFVQVDLSTDIGEENDLKLPTSFALAQNYPNPFNPATTINYQLPERSHVVVEIFNILGRTVRTLVNEGQPAGYYEINWSGKNEGGRQVATGIYFYRIRAGDFVRTKKMLLLK